LRYEHRAAASLSGCGIVIMCTLRLHLDNASLASHYRCSSVHTRGDEMTTSHTAAETIMNAIITREGAPRTEQEARNVGERVAEHLTRMHAVMASEFGEGNAAAWIGRQTEWLAGA